MFKEINLYLKDLILRDKNLIWELALHAYTRASQRGTSRSETWMAYKNNSDFHPQIFNLSNPFDLQRSWREISPIDLPDIVPRYATYLEFLILIVKKSDIIIVDDREFTIGEFLGSGNSTHIYRLLNDPHKVIRLPFLAAFLTEEIMSTNFQIQIMLSFMVETSKLISTSKRSAFLESDHRGRYALAKYIDGKQTGREFLRTFAAAYSELFKDGNIMMKTIGLRRELGGETLEKFEDLLSAMHSLNLNLKSSHDGPGERYGDRLRSELWRPENMEFVWSRFGMFVARQLLWNDSEPRQWFLIDAG
jgi:hypothetical protein